MQRTPPPAKDAELRAITAQPDASPSVRDTGVSLLRTLARTAEA